MSQIPSYGMLRLMRRCGKGMSAPLCYLLRRAAGFVMHVIFNFLFYWEERTEAFVLAQRFRINWGDLMILMEFVPGHTLGGCVCDFY